MPIQPWTPQEDELLEILAGTVPSYRLHTLFNRQAKKLQGTIGGRRESAILKRCSDLGLSRKVDQCQLYSATAIAQALGFDTSTITKWCRQGLKYETQGHTFFITVKNLCEFWIENPLCFEYAKSVDSRTISFILGCFEAVSPLGVESRVTAKQSIIELLQTRPMTRSEMLATTSKKAAMIKALTLMVKGGEVVHNGAGRHRVYKLATLKDMSIEIIPGTYQDVHGATVRVVGMVWDRISPKIVILKPGGTHRETVGIEEFSKAYTLLPECPDGVCKIKGTTPGFKGFEPVS